MDESPAEQARKYIEKKKGWRPERRTVLYLSVMFAVLVISAVAVPRLLPGSIPAGEMLLGRNGGVATLSIGGGSPELFVKKPAEGESYTAWAISPTREEVVLGCYKESNGDAPQASVQVRSAFSGRVQTGWDLEPDLEDPAISELGYLPQHNQIWFLSAGRMYLIDIKSAEIRDFPFKGPGGKGSIEVPEQISGVGFSPEKGILAISEPTRIKVVRGLATGRDSAPLKAETVLDTNDAGDSGGVPLGGIIESFTWLEEERLAVIVSDSGDTLESPDKVATAVYLLSIEGENTTKAEIIVPPEEGIRYLDVSRSPVGTDFALLLDGGKNLALREYDSSGRLLRKVRLQRGEWRTPLIWTSP